MNILNGITAWLECLAEMLHFKDSHWITQFIAALKSLFINPFDPGDLYHYGCPNSKRTVKLQLKKRMCK